MTRTFVIAGLILLAAFLPLAALPITIVVLLGALLFTAYAENTVSADARAVALVALKPFRAPPSR